MNFLLADSTALFIFFSSVFFPSILEVFLGFLFGAYKMYKRKKKETLFILLSLILPILILTIVGLFFPVYSFRYLTFLVPLYIIPIAYLSKFKKKGLIALGIISILWILVLIQYYSIVTIPYWATHFAI